MHVKYKYPQIATKYNYLNIIHLLFWTTEEVPASIV